MNAENKTKETNDSVASFVMSLDDDEVISDCMKLIDMMSETSGREPRMWGPSIIGFDTYHYKYASGREGDAPVIAFSPRKGKLTVYVDEAIMSSHLFSRLGKHSTSKVCIYIKHLSDVDITVLSQIIAESHKLTKSKQEYR